TNASLITLSAPLSIEGSTSGYRRPDPQVVPGAGGRVHCYGFGPDGTGQIRDLRFRMFDVTAQGWNYFWLENGANAIEPEDMGGPCFLAGNDVDDERTPVVGTIDSQDAQARVGNIDVADYWVDGMIASRHLRAAQSPFELQNQSSFQCLDVGNGSYFPFVHVN